MEGTFALRIKGSFAAAHRIMTGEGEEPLHGHTYQVEAVFRGPLGRFDMVTDFHILKEAVSVVLRRYDHTYLNDVAAFEGRWPTAEVLAARIAAELGDRLRQHPLTVGQVTVWESDRAGVTFTPGGDGSA